MIFSKSIKILKKFVIWKRVGKIDNYTIFLLAIYIFSYNFLVASLGCKMSLLKSKFTCGPAHKVTYFLKCPTSMSLKCSFSSRWKKIYGVFFPFCFEMDFGRFYMMIISFYKWKKSTKSYCLFDQAPLFHAKWLTQHGILCNYYNYT